MPSSSHWPCTSRPSWTPSNTTRPGWVAALAGIGYLKTSPDRAGVKSRAERCRRCSGSQDGSTGVPARPMDHDGCEAMKMAASTPWS